VNRYESKIEISLSGLTSLDDVRKVNAQVEKFMREWYGDVAGTDLVIGTTLREYDVSDDGAVTAPAPVELDEIVSDLPPLPDGVWSEDEYRATVRRIMGELLRKVIEPHDAMEQMVRAAWVFAERLHGEPFVVLG
jgi:hypothetical protein